MRSTAALLPALLLMSACDAAATAEAKSDNKLEVLAPVVAVDGGAAVIAGGAAGVAVDADASAGVAVDVGAAARTGVLADGKLTVSAEAFKLGSVTTLIQSGTIETAEELELAVNDPEADINTLDIDLDGKIDHVEVVEVREDARVDFQMRVIPSSKASIEHSVELASASLVAVKASSEISFSASFSASVGFFAGASAQTNVYSFVTPARFEASAVVVALPLLSWAFIVERPVYTSVFVQAKTGRWIPPGHLKHGLWKATGVDSRGNGKAGGKFEGHIGGHGGGNGGGNGGNGKAGKSSPVKHASKAEASGSKHGSASASSGGSKGGSSSSKGGSSGGSKGGSSSSKGGSSGGSSSKGGSSGGSKGGSGSGGGGKGGKGK